MTTEWEKGDEGDKGDAPKGNTVSDEDKALLDQVKGTGLSGPELVAYARKGYQDQHAGKAAGSDEGDNKPDPTDPVTRADLDQATEKAKAEAKQESQMQNLQMANQTKMESKIKALAGDKTAYGEALTPRKLEAIQAQVAKDLGKNINIRTMSEAQFDEEVEKVTQSVIKEEMDLSKKVTSTDEQTDLAARLEAQQNADDSGAAGGAAGKQSTPGASTATASTHDNMDPENIQYGIGTDWPNQDQVDRERDHEMEAFDKQTAAGRK